MKITKVEIKTETIEELDKAIDDMTDSLNFFMDNHPDFSVVIDKYIEENTAIVKICQLQDHVN